MYNQDLYITQRKYLLDKPHFNLGNFKSPRNRAEKKSFMCKPKQKKTP